jgi:hypothetical protein
MTNREIFNRQYTDYLPGGQQVWLVNGASVTTTPATTQTYTAGESLVQGQVVYVSGTYALSAIAVSGADPTQYNPVGITAESAALASSVSVVVDDTAVIGSSNITGGGTLIPGQYYYLSKYTGQITPYSTASGTVTASGGYSALVYMGQAMSLTALQIEIEPPVVLYD